MTAARGGCDQEARRATYEEKSTLIGQSPGSTTACRCCASSLHRAGMKKVREAKWMDDLVQPEGTLME